VVDIQLDNWKKRKYQDVKGFRSQDLKGFRSQDLKGFRFRRMTHSRYDCGKAAWTTTLLSTNPNALWNMLPEMDHMYALGCLHY
jgi:hypothetical protein